ncbi:MAG: multicopper oxidase domain-containing protein, partial [Chloroflexi bacterium]|nr:multicopper oxidase domain-containing protein [Chloroflexota bacterium]
MKVNRRAFIKFAGTGIIAVAAGAVVVTRLRWGVAIPARISLRLAITEALVEMVDHTSVFHWAFEDLDNQQHLPQVPGPFIEAIEGDTIELSLTNNLPDAHGFRIPGAPGTIGSGIEIAPGKTEGLVFPAPPAGSYLYFDHLNAPVNRVLGLHGPMVVLPASGNTPYSNPTPNVQRLFDDLGTTAHFPGEPWKPERSRIWLFSTVDTTFNAMAERGKSIDA